MPTPWRVYVGDKNGNEIIDPVTKRPRYIYYPDAQRFCNEAEVMAYTKVHFHNITPLRAVQTEEATGILVSVPAAWHEWGTNRMKAEIEAGLRPHSDYLLPPLELGFDLPQTPTERKSFWPRR